MALATASGQHNVSLKNTNCFVQYRSRLLSLFHTVHSTSVLLNDSQSSSSKKEPINQHFSWLKFSVLLRRGNCLLRRNAVIVSSSLGEEVFIGAIALFHQHVNKIRAVQRRRTIKLCGKPRSKGLASSMRFICSAVRVMSSASIFSCRCSTLRPPMIGNT